MRTKFKLVGLTKAPNRPFTCETKDGELFWPQSGMASDRHAALFDYKKTTGWEARLTAVVKHDGLRKDGTPINGMVVEVEEE